MTADKHLRMDERSEQVGPSVTAIRREVGDEGRRQRRIDEMPGDAAVDDRAIVHTRLTQPPLQTFGVERHVARLMQRCPECHFSRQYIDAAWLQNPPDLGKMGLEVIP